MTDPAVVVAAVAPPRRRARPGRGRRQPLPSRLRGQPAPPGGRRRRRSPVSPDLCRRCSSVALRAAAHDRRRRRPDGGRRPVPPRLRPRLRRGRRAASTGRCPTPRPCPGGGRSCSTPTAGTVDRCPPGTAPRPGGHGQGLGRRPGRRRHRRPARLRRAGVARRRPRRPVRPRRRVHRRRRRHLRRPRRPDRRVHRPRAAWPPRASATGTGCWAAPPVHHLVDPSHRAAGRPPRWRTVTVAAASCVDANTASTAVARARASGARRGWPTRRPAGPPGGPRRVRGDRRRVAGRHPPTRPDPTGGARRDRRRH